MMLSRRTLMGGLGAAAACSVCGGAIAAPGAVRPLVDFHRHLSPPGFDESTGTPLFWVPKFPVDKTLADMDAAGVQTAMLSLPWAGKAGRARDAARRVNDYYAEVIARYPGRFGMFATLPLPDVEASLAEVEYALDVLKADGVALATSYGGIYPADPRFRPLLTELNRRKAIAYVHPLSPACCTRILPQVPDAMIEFGADTSRAIASLLFAGPSTSFPDIRFIFTHAGGVMTSIQARWAIFDMPEMTQYHLPGMETFWPHGVQYELRRFYYDVAQSFTRGPLLALREMAPISQILFGTDYPYVSASLTAGSIESARVFTPEELRAIYVDNPRRLLPRVRSSPS